MTTSRRSPRSLVLGLALRRTCARRRRAATTPTERRRRPTGDGDTVRLLTHDSFLLSDGVLDAFTEETGIEVEVIQGGDAGTGREPGHPHQGQPAGRRAVRHRLHLPVPGPRRRPVRALRGRGSRPGRRVAAPRPRAPRHADRLRRRVPQLRQGVLRGARPAGARRASTTSPTPPTRDLLVVENPATSSPGPGVPPAPASRPSARTAGRTWWSDLRDNGVQVVDGWEEAYYSSFSGGGGSEGDRPLVVSYASSPPAEVRLRRPARRRVARPA